MDLGLRLINMYPRSARTAAAQMVTVAGTVTA